ncbi:MAG: lectin like domain-containing protein [Oscillospiraceae bacterium]
MGKRVTAFFTALVTAAVNIPIVSASAEINLNTDILPEIKQAPLSDAYMDYLDNPDKYLIKPSVIDMNETADIDINNNLPEKFDLRSEGLVSSVKNQGIYGTCWAYAAVSSMETSLIRKNQFIDLSEWQMAYFGTVSPDDSLSSQPDYEKLLENGGSSAMIVNNIAGWQGISDESRFPYEYPDIYKEENRFITDYHADDICMAFQEREPSEKINAEVKDLIYSGNAITISFLSYEGFLNDATSAYYGSMEVETSDEIYDTSHAVTIIGWDDNYSKENFRDDIRPQNDGAWLIKNSWGEEYGNNGYYWISYEDDYLRFDTAYSIDFAEDYDNIYQYDYDMNGWWNTYSISDNNTSYISSIFTAESDEYISGAGFYTTDNGTEYEVCIYTDLKDAENPVSGKQRIGKSGVEKYAGYHTVDFLDSVYVNEGQTYSVVIRLSNPENEYVIPTTSIFMYDETEREAYKKLSYISADGKEWTDSMEYPTDFGENGIGVVCCKVFTNDADKIEFSDYSPYVEKNTSISLSNDSGKDMYYSTDGKTWSLYSEPIVIDKGKSIYASLSETGENAVVHKYSIKKAVLSSLHYDNQTYYGDINVIEGEEAITDITEYIPGYIEEITIIPAVCGNSSITINGEQVESGSDYTFNIRNTSKLDIVVSAENQESTEYTINFVRKYISFYGESLMTSDELLTVTAPDGKVIAAWDSISDYIGQTLTAEYNDGSGTFEIYVPKRPDAPDNIEYEISYEENSITFNQEVYYGFNMDKEPLYSTYEKEGDFPVTFASGKTMYVSIPASETQFESECAEFKIPALSAAPDADIEAADIQEHSISLKPVKDVEYGIFNMDFYEYAVSDAKLCKFEWSDSPEFKNLLAGHEYCFAIRYPATDENVYSDIKYAYFSTAGVKQLETIDYANELMTINGAYQAEVTDEDGNVINYNSEYDYYIGEISLSDYTGQTLTIRNIEDNSLYDVKIPERPDFNGEYSVNYNDITVTFTDTGSDIMYQAMYEEWKNLEFDSETHQGIIDEIWINSEEDSLIYVKNPATSEHFASNTEIINIGKMPVCEYQVEIESATMTTLTLKSYENAEYALIQYSSGEVCEFTDSNKFTELKPGEYYIAMIRLGATEDTVYSSANEITIKMPDDENSSVKTFTYGDIDGDGIVTSYDALCVLQHITNIAKLDEVLMSFSDCDFSGSVTSYDALLILQYTTGMLDQLPVFDESAVG